MFFDDYNYDQVNQYILLEEPKDPIQKKKVQAMNQMSKGTNNSVEQISAIKLEKAISEHYDHESIKMPDEVYAKGDDEHSETSDEDKTRRIKGRKGSQGSKNTKKSDTATELKSSKKNSEIDGSGSDSDSQEKEEEVKSEKEDEPNVDDLMMHIYYQPHEIEKTKCLQEMDPFEDLIYDKEAATQGVNIDKTKTKINISEFMPK
jgi:hypothetical protein